MSKFDALYRSILLTKFFTKGWGNPDNLRRIFEFRKILSNRELCGQLVPEDYPIIIDKKIEQKECKILEGHFMSPLDGHLPNIMPEEVKRARFQAVLPSKWRGPHKPIVLHLAGTGDHGFGRRRALLARPLVKESGIGSIILENPFYGVRKPKSQLRSSLHNVSDLFVMGGALILESLVLLHWCEKNGYGPLAITGISMGGFMASLAATNWHKPISLIPCLSWSTASIVFTQGVMSGAIPWQKLQKQYLGDSVYQNDLSKLLVSPEKLVRSDAFRLGQEFAKHYPSSIADMMAYQKLNEKGERGEIPGHSADMNDHNEDYVINERSQSGTTRDGKRNSTMHKSGQVTNVRHKSSQAKQNDENINTATDSYQNNFSDYIKFSQWKSTFNDTRSFYSWLEYLKLPTSVTFKSNKKAISDEALDFMKGVMDECTHLGNFCSPIDTSLIIIVAAEHDAYVPRGTSLSLQQLWPGSEVRYVNTGHIGAFLTKQHVFREAITDSIQRQIEKHHS